MPGCSLRWVLVLHSLLCSGQRAAHGSAPSGAQETASGYARVDARVVDTFPNGNGGVPHGACRIIKVAGLGWLDGEYTLASTAFETTRNGRPLWAGATAGVQRALLSWEPAAGNTWAFWYRGADSVEAYLADSLAAADALPPATSSAWKILNTSTGQENAVEQPVWISCPGCETLTVSSLPGRLRSCDGTYLLHGSDSADSTVLWTHVAAECSVAYYMDGLVLVTAARPQGRRRPEGGYDSHLARIRHGLAASSAGSVSTAALVTLGEAVFECTAAGSTTAVAFHLGQAAAAGGAAVAVAGGQADIREAAAGSSGPWAGEAPSPGLGLATAQNASIVSTAQGGVHVRVVPSAALARAAGGLDLSPLELGDVAVSVTKDHRQILPLAVAAVEGFHISLVGVPGGHFVTACLQPPPAHRGQEGGPAAAAAMAEPPGSSTAAVSQDCLVESTVSVSVFVAGQHMIQPRRPWLDGAASLMRGSMGAGLAPPGGEEGGGGKDAEARRWRHNGDIRRVLFVVDMWAVDGYKLSVLNQMRHLPPCFRTEALDLTCEGDESRMDFKVALDRAGFPLTRMCVKLPQQVWDAAADRGRDMGQHLHAELHEAPAWAHLAGTAVAEGLGPLREHLRGSDVMVMSNGAHGGDGYLLELARLAGVPSRIVNLGALAHMSARYTGATLFAAPSHFMSHDAQVLRHLAGREVVVCHPMMDWAGASGDVSGGYDGDSLGDAAAAASADDVATVVFVGRLVTVKTPDVFVRAMAILAGRRPLLARPVRGVAIGAGPFLAGMEALAAELGADVTFTGYLPSEQVARELRGATALAFPSFGSETFGMVAPEAMLLGVPVVTFGFGGSMELVRHMENGLVAREPTPIALADELERLVQDPGLRNELGARAKADAGRVCSQSSLVRCHADLYDR